MAITAATKTTDFAGFLTPTMSAPIFERAYKVSIAQQLATKIPLGANGVSVPVVTGRMSAGWVDEAAQKPVSNASIALKTISPKKIAAIAVVSAEVIRANPGNYMQLIRPQIGEAFALAFDAAAMHGIGSPFSTFLDQTGNAVEDAGAAPAFTNVYDDLNSALNILVSAGKPPTGWAFDSRFETVLYGAKDTAGRPLFLNPVYTEGSPVISGSLLGRRTFMGPGVYESTHKVYGYLGDWSQAVWGTVGGITYDVSTEATVTINGVLTSLFENNLVAVRAEAEFGWLVNDPSSFVKITNAT